MISRFKTWITCQKGGTAIEYGLIAAGIALVIAASIFTFGEQLQSLFYDDIATALSGPG